MAMSLMGLFMSKLCGHIGGYKAKEANNASALYVTANDGQNTFNYALTGDAERDQTKETVTSGDVGDIDLKVGHHGRQSRLSRDRSCAKTRGSDCKVLERIIDKGHPKRGSSGYLRGCWCKILLHKIMRRHSIRMGLGVSKNML